MVSTQHFHCALKDCKSLCSFSGLTLSSSCLFVFLAEEKQLALIRNVSLMQDVSPVTNVRSPDSSDGEISRMKYPFTPDPPALEDVYFQLRSENYDLKKEVAALENELENWQNLPMVPSEASPARGSASPRRSASPSDVAPSIIRESIDRDVSSIEMDPSFAGMSPRRAISASPASPKSVRDESVGTLALVSQHSPSSRSGSSVVDQLRTEIQSKAVFLSSLRARLSQRRDQLLQAQSEGKLHLPSPQQQTENSPSAMKSNPSPLKGKGPASSGSTSERNLPTTVQWKPVVEDGDAVSVAEIELRRFLDGADDSDSVRSASAHSVAASSQQKRREFTVKMSRPSPSETTISFESSVGNKTSNSRSVAADDILPLTVMTRERSFLSGELTRLQTEVADKRVSLELKTKAIARQRAQRRIEENRMQREVEVIVQAIEHDARQLQTFREVNAREAEGKQSKFVTSEQARQRLSMKEKL